MKNVKIDKKLAKKILNLVDKGLVSGLGKPEPGKACVEAVVCMAMGLPHGDNPPCVGKQVREFKISLNDMEWPSDKDRTEGMRKLAIAQLGSNEIDQDRFLKVLGFNCTTRVLPVLVENALEEDKDNEFVKKNLKVEELKSALKGLKSAKNFDEAREATKKIRDIYWASAYAYASTYAYAYAYASASAYAYAYASAYLKKNTRFFLKILNLIAGCGLDALKELKSPGCRWLDLCD